MRKHIINIATAFAMMASVVACQKGDLSGGESVGNPNGNEIIVNLAQTKALEINTQVTEFYLYVDQDGDAAIGGEGDQLVKLKQEDDLWVSERVDGNVDFVWSDFDNANLYAIYAPNNEITNFATFASLAVNSSDDLKSNDMLVASLGAESITKDRETGVVTVKFDHLLSCVYVYLSSAEGSDSKHSPEWVAAALSEVTMSGAVKGATYAMASTETGYELTLGEVEDLSFKQVSIVDFDGSGSDKETLVFQAFVAPQDFESLTFNYKVNDNQFSSKVTAINKQTTFIGGESYPVQLVIADEYVEEVPDIPADMNFAATGFTPAENDVVNIYGIDSEKQAMTYTSAAWNPTTVNFDNDSESYAPYAALNHEIENGEVLNVISGNATYVSYAPETAMTPVNGNDFSMAFENIMSTVDVTLTTTSDLSEAQWAALKLSIANVIGSATYNMTTKAFTEVAAGTCEYNSFTSATDNECTFENIIGSNVTTDSFVLSLVGGAVENVVVTNVDNSYTISFTVAGAKDLGTDVTAPSDREEVDGGMLGAKK